VLFPDQGGDHPASRSVKLLHPSRRTEEAVAEIMIMLHALFESGDLLPRFVGGYFFHAGIGRSVNAVEAVRSAMASVSLDALDLRNSGLVGIIVSGPEEMDPGQYSAAVSLVAEHVERWNHFVPVRRTPAIIDGQVRACILASGIRPKEMN